MISGYNPLRDDPDYIRDAEFLGAACSWQMGLVSDSSVLE